MKGLFSSLLLIILHTQLGLSQSIGDWRMHINYRNSNFGVAGDNKILSANDKSVLIYNLNDGSILTLDKAKGLSDYGVSAISYDLSSNTFVIAYDNSNIDLLKGNTLINLPDIKNKLAAGSKTINNIYCKDGIAYLSTDFGVVALDLINEEVDNTYVIGSTGDQTIVLDCSISQDTIYALTAEGMKKAYLETGNLLDYSQWDHSFSSLPGVTAIEMYDDRLYALANNLYLRANGNWVEVANAAGRTFSNLTSSDYLSFVSDAIDVLRYESGMLDTLDTGFLIDPTYSIGYQGNKYFGDNKFGLFQGNQSISTSSSPFTNEGFRAISIGDKIVISSGGFNKNLDGNGNVEGGFYEFENNQWVNHNIYSSIGTSTPSRDLNRMAFNSFDGKLYVAMFNGLIEFDFNSIEIYNTTNSPIDSAIGNTFFQKTSGVDVDSEGNVWVVNPQTTAALLVKSLNGNWTEFVLGNDNSKFNNLLIDSYDQKWIALRNQGILIFKEGENMSSTGAQQINLSTDRNQGNLPNNNVNCIAEDKNQQIWIGTDEGIALFTCPRDIFDPSTSCKVSDRITNTFDQFTEYLFETDAVTAIEVDGANRKWIGTSAGVWLLSEDGKTEILRFNTENSPIPSNTIYDITVNQGTGEVFILTDQGMASYFSDATESAENYDDIIAYPNPVRPEYTGYISITGFVEDAFVKITDQHGVLINEGFALGGKYIWDGNDYNGRRANTGIYYIFSANPDASEKVVTKIAFVK